MVKGLLDLIVCDTSISLMTEVPEDADRFVQVTNNFINYFEHQTEAPLLVFIIYDSVRAITCILYKEFQFYYEVVQYELTQNIHD